MSWKPEFGNPYPGILLSREKLLKTLVDQPYVKEAVLSYTANLDVIGARVLGYLVKKNNQKIEEVIALVAVKYETVEGVMTEIQPVRMYPPPRWDYVDC